jgi:hypothetical protein
MDIWSAPPSVSATLDRVEELDHPAAILRTVAPTCRNMRKEFSDIVRMLLGAAPHEQRWPSRRQLQVLERARKYR